MSASDRGGGGGGEGDAPRGARDRDNGIVRDQHHSMPRGNNVALISSRSNRSARLDGGLQHGALVDARPAQSTGTPRVTLSTCTISVVERSGYSLLPNAKRSSAGSAPQLPINAKPGRSRILHHRRAGVEFEPFGDRGNSRTSPHRARSACHDRIGSSAIAAVPRITAPAWRRRNDALHAARTRHRIHHRTEVDCADSTLSAKPAGNSVTVVIAHPSPAHQRVEIDPPRGAFPPPSGRARLRIRCPQWRQHLGFDRIGMLRRSGSARRTSRSSAPCRGRDRAYSRTRSRRVTRRTAARDTVASPRLTARRRRRSGRAPSPGHSPAGADLRGPAWRGRRDGRRYRQLPHAPAPPSPPAAAPACYFPSIPIPISPCRQEVVDDTRQLHRRAP